MSYRNWHDALIALMANLGPGLAAGEPHQEPWLALYLTLAGYIGAEGPNSDIAAPEAILESVSPRMSAYRRSREVLESLPAFQQQVAATLAQLRGGEAYAALTGNAKIRTVPIQDEE